MMIAQGVDWSEVGTLGGIAAVMLASCVAALVWIAKYTVKNIATSQTSAMKEQHEIAKKLVDAALANMGAHTQAIDAMTKALQNLATEQQRSSAVRDERDKALFELLRDIKMEVRGRIRDNK